MTCPDGYEKNPQGYCVEGESVEARVMSSTYRMFFLGKTKMSMISGK